MIEVVGFRRNRITQEDCTRFAEMLLESLTEMVGEDEDVGSLYDVPEDIDDGKEGIEMMATAVAFALRNYKPRCCTEIVRVLLTLDEAKAIVAGEHL